MSTISASIALRDGMSAPLKNIRRETGNVIGSFAKTRAASERMLSTSKIAAAKSGMEAVDTKVRSVGRSLRKADSEQNKFNRDIKSGGKAAGYLKDQLKGVLKAAAAYATIHAGVQFAKDSIQSANDRAQAETKLNTVMKQRMGATNQMIDATKKLTAVQQANGVIADDVQMAGAQQLSTFLNSSKALNTLIPAMNDLATQQNGVAVSSGDMQNIANMIGKAMQGQVGALSRVGITFSDAEAHALKFGTEEQRAATMAQIITNNVGHMNEALAATPAGKMAQMANAWEGIKQMVGAQLYPSVLRLFTAIQSNMPTVERVFQGVAAAISVAVSVLWVMAKAAGAVGSFMADHWGAIKPIIEGVVTALVIYKAATIASAIGDGIAVIAHGLLTAAKVAATLATWALAAAQWALNAAMEGNPILFIIMLVALLVMALIGWIQKVGGVKIAWMIAMDAMQTTGSKFKIAFMKLGFKFESIWSNITLAVAKAKVFILNHLGDLKVKGLSVLQSFINGAIDIINKLIDKVNLIPGIAIDHVQHVTFATDAKVANDAAKAARNADLKAQEQALKDQEKQNQAALTSAQLSADVAHQKRLSNIEKAQKAKKAKAKDKKKPGGSSSAGKPSPAAAALGKSAATTAKNTGKMAKSMGSSDEDLKYLRDIAERDTINRFTTAQLSVTMNTTAQINSDMDIDGVIRKLEDKTYEKLTTMAEGV